MADKRATVCIDIAKKIEKKYPKILLINIVVVAHCMFRKQKCIKYL